MHLLAHLFKFLSRSVLLAAFFTCLYLWRRCRELAKRLRSAEKRLKSGRKAPTPDMTGRTCFDPIGYIESCFPEKRATPRQGLLVPDSRGQLALRKDIDKLSLDGLLQFSHIWIIYCFHENTKGLKQLGLKQWKQPNNAKQTTIKPKVQPPKLGHKVGLFSTRTPHRPNPIGLSLVKLEGISRGKLEVSGLDLIDGTPVLDIKPYAPNYECVPTAKVPKWVADASDPAQSRLPVKFSADALAELHALMPHVSFYSTPTSVVRAVTQVLSLDIRAGAAQARARQRLKAGRVDKVKGGSVKVSNVVSTCSDRRDAKLVSIQGKSGIFDLFCFPFDGLDFTCNSVPFSLKSKNSTEETPERTIEHIQSDRCLALEKQEIHVVSVHQLGHSPLSLEQKHVT